MDSFALVQWPAMVVTVAASWLIASRAPRRRRTGFWMFLASNALWILWGWHDRAYALILLQICLAAMNIRGAAKNDSEAAARAEPDKARPAAPAPEVSQRTSA